MEHTNYDSVGLCPNPLQDYGGISAVDNEGNLENLYSKVDKIRAFWKNGDADDNLSRYIPNILPIARQN